MPNSKGLAWVHSDGYNTVVVTLGTNENTVQVYDHFNDKLEEYDVEENIAALAVNIHGGIFAHTDETGTKIRIRNISDGEIVQVYNRGKDHAEVTGIAFNEYCMRMVVSSLKTTVHVFAIPKSISDKAIQSLKARNSTITDLSEMENNKNSMLLESRHGSTPGFFGRMIKGEGETSYLKIYVDHPEKYCTIIKNTLTIIRSDGTIHYVDIQEEGGIYATNERKVVTAKLF